jgi:hypothetical protein
MHPFVHGTFFSYVIVNLVTIFRIVIEVLLDYTGLPCTAFQVLLIVGCCGRNVLNELEHLM